MTRSKISKNLLRSASLENVRSEHIGRLFLIGSRIFERIAISELRRLGFSDLRLVHLALIRSLPIDGLRTSEIGDIAGMTKQAVGQLAMELEDAGYVIREPDPTDGRAKLVKYAARGHELVAAIPGVLRHTEAEIENVIGSKDFLVVRRALKSLVVAVNSDGDDPD